MNRSTWLRLSVATTALAVTAPLAPTAYAAVDPGAPGIGDPYYANYGNGGYLADSYRIDIDYNPTTNYLRGRTTIEAKATQNLSSFNLDLALRAKLVEVNGRRATFVQGDHELVVTPQYPLTKGKPFQVRVTYAGDPEKQLVDGYSPWIRTKDGGAAVGEPEIAAWWFPSNDHPRDKATFDVNVTVPKDTEVLGNGTLVSSTVSGPWRTWRWRESRPMATYLAMFVAGQFDITRSTWRGKPVINAVAVDGGVEGENARKDLARTPEIIQWGESHFGAYPFEALGGVAPAADFGFALENQTRPVYSRGFWDEGDNLYVVVHENAHQWFGDSVSVHNWRDIWLNEGFATYVTWMWSEDHDEGSAQDLFDSYYLRPPDEDFWKVTIGDPGAGREFNGAVYTRGAMTLQALRNRIGDTDFATLMRTWPTKKRDGNAQISEFIALAEQLSGENLRSFFTAWLYTGQRPAPTKDNGFPPDYQLRRRAMAEPQSRAVLDRNLALSAAQAASRR